MFSILVVQMALEKGVTTDFNGMNIAEHRANKQKTKKRKKTNDIFISNVHQLLGQDVPYPISLTSTNTLNYDMARTGGCHRRNHLKPLQVTTQMTGESCSLSIQNDAKFAFLKEMESSHHFFATDTISPNSMVKISVGIGFIRKGTTEDINETVLNCANTYADQGKSAEELLPMVYNLYKYVSNL